MMKSLLGYNDLPAHIQAHSLTRVVRDISRTWLLVALAIAVFNLFPNFFSGVLAALIIGTLQYHLNILAHDGLHFSLSEDKKINDWMTRWLLLGPQLVPLTAIRQNHLNHHKTLGQADDLDRQYYDWENRCQRSKFLLWIIGAFCGRMVIPILKKLMSKYTKTNSIKKIDPKVSQNRQYSRNSNRIFTDVLSIVVTQSILLAAFWFLTFSPWLYLGLWVIPLFTVMTGLNSLRSCLEHVNVLESQASLGTFKSNPIERFFLSPFNMNYHAEHHLFMAVPYHNLPELSRYLAQQNLSLGFKEFDSYWQKFLSTWALMS